jgi:hypothetical protein
MDEMKYFALFPNHREWNGQFSSLVLLSLLCVFQNFDKGCCHVNKCYIISTSCLGSLLFMSLRFCAPQLPNSFSPKIAILDALNPDLTL